MSQPLDTIMHFTASKHSLAFSTTAEGLRVSQHIIYHTELQRTNALEEVLLNIQGCGICFQHLLY